jgi:hypothetical protein
VYLQSETTVRSPMIWKRHGGLEVIVAPIGGDPRGAGKAAAGRDVDPRIGACAPVEARDRQFVLQRLSYDVERGLGMLRVVLNCGIFGLIVHIS